MLQSPPKQTIQGRALEWSCAISSCDVLGVSREKIVKDQSSENSKLCFGSVPDEMKHDFLKSAALGMQHIFSLENIYSIDNVSLIPCSAGQTGDVRDLIITSQGFDIGISCKNNNDGIKSPRFRVEDSISEGWLKTPRNPNWNSKTKPVFDEIKANEGQAWSKRYSSAEKAERIYRPLLEAMIDDIRHAQENETEEGFATEKFLNFIVGRQDFYKLVNFKKTVMIQKFDMTRRNNRQKKTISKIINMELIRPTTAIIILNNGWQFSLRAHNAETKIKLGGIKIEVKLIGQPQTLYSHHIQK